jgi:hypothetical protein
MPSNSKKSSKTNRNTAAQDAAYAEALQEEYRKDFLRRQAKKNKYAAARRERDAQEAQAQQTAAYTSLPPPMEASAPPEDLLSSPYVPSNSTFAASTNPYPMARSQTAEDELYARQLQEQLEREAQREHGSRSSRGRSSRQAPTMATYVDLSNVVDVGDERDVASTRLSQELRDAEYAKRLQEKEERQRQRHSRNVIVPGVPLVSEKYGRTQSDFSDERTSIDSDEAAARRIQQELEDADYAQRLSVLERQEAAARAAQAQEDQAAAQRGTPRKRCWSRIVPLLICGAVIAIIPLLFVFGVFDSQDIPFWDDLFGDDWIGSDPWSGNTTGLDGPALDSNAYAWPSNGNGVTIDILNACSDDWQVFVNQALANWDNGAPIDSLAFNTRRISYESACSEVRGALKICNGNYGDTRWRGLNEVMLSPRQNTIISSTARLNEFYLARESDAQKLYTACHELGHGFGLPHWDENFYNKDLGNCMDYTQNPEENSKPNESNFLYLAQLYGGRNVTAATAKESIPPDRRRRLRRERREQEKMNVQNSKVVDMLPHNPKRRVLHVGEEHEVHLIPSDEHEGYIILQQYLLALPDR